MSIPDQIKDLLHLLSRGTQDKSLQWQATADEDAFRLVSQSANIRLIRSETYDQELMQVYLARKLQILNDKGRLIEEYSPSTAQDMADFDELFTQARRSACKTDDVLRKLKSELEAQVNR